MSKTSHQRVVGIFDYDPMTPGYLALFPSNGEGIRTLPIPGVRCPTCHKNGDEVWVVPGLICPKCRTCAPDEGLIAHPYHGDDDAR